MESHLSQPEVKEPIAFPSFLYYSCTLGYRIDLSAWSFPLPVHSVDRRMCGAKIRAYTWWLRKGYSWKFPGKYLLWMVTGQEVGFPNQSRFFLRRLVKAAARPRTYDSSLPCQEKIFNSYTFYGYPIPLLPSPSHCPCKWSLPRKRTLLFRAQRPGPLLTKCDS